MRKGDIVVNPWVSAYFNGELNPNYATIYLGDNKSLDYKGRVCKWADKIYKEWKVIGHIDLYGIVELAIRDAVFAEEIADTPQNERSEFVKVSDRECPWCKAVCASTDKYCHECGWHIADTPQTEETCERCVYVRGSQWCQGCNGTPKRWDGEKIVDTPQTETQTETQNSNLTFEKSDCPWK